MTILRWILFLPAAFIVSIMLGGLINFVSQSLFPEWISWASSGAFSGMGFIMTGLKVAPRVTKTVKWSLIIIVGLLGFLSVIGSLIGDNKIAALAGVVMVFIAISFVNTPVDELLNEA